MGKTNPVVKAKTLLTKYKSKDEALKQAQQVFYMAPSPYWQEVINQLNQHETFNL